MSTSISPIERKRLELANGLISNKQYIDLIPVEKQENFKNNFLELATQDYLLSIISTKELIRFAVNVTKIGLDIAPSSKEVYILPFETKVNNQKVMLPQAIIPLNGVQQLAYQKGFFLLLDAVYKFDDGTSESESKLSRAQQAFLQTANSKWVDEHFIGFDCILTDLKGELPTQIKFVDLNYMKAATKTIKDERWKLQTWRHKAVRRAYGDFMIPKNRKIETFESIEILNDSILAEADVDSDVYLTIETENALKQLGIVLSKNNGIAIASNYLNKEKYLEEFGFTKNGGNWSINYLEVPKVVSPVEEQSPKVENKSQSEKPVPKVVSPAVKLFNYLLSKNMKKDEIKVFVGEVLGLTKEDIEGINDVLSDLDNLDSLISDFIAEQR
ncbi:hypothetical protein ACOTWR_11650 [Aliarcobacter butzleri]|uniref:hypothetical protein n=1 Tax=Aliarcobacter butzleri TaxID=28197 RepID=UPI0021B3DCFB|nr:hypothetical protein [Aliarcobacter butzleri]MCT7563334.1 hypothetical protein [Aliarcobacter butzleri]MCT7580220.1 hypothetical protein [Aliarcobacter butzleri]MCT7647518.1 hypothetical protein [Aliarcobacter butzleri]